MIFKPHNYQEYAKQWIIEKDACGLFLDLGMGKTVCTLTAVEELLYDYFDVSKVLVIAPLRVAEDTWSSETKKWEHLKNLKISKILGKEEVRITALNTVADIYIINRENIKWLVEYLGKNWCFDMVVIDELSSFKSSKSNRFRALKKVRPFIKKIVGLTGTPAPNGLLDLWSQVYLLDGGYRLGKTITSYKDRYFQPDKRNGAIIFSWKLISGAEDRIYEKLKDICISMKACDYLDLPERIDNNITVKLSKNMQEKYKELEKELLLSLAEGDIVANTAAVLTNKLLQMANGAVYDENGKVREFHKEKLKALDDIIETANGKPILIFYAYKHDLERIKNYLKDKKVRCLDVSKDIEDWNKGIVEIMLVHPASAGHGLNLQYGGNIIVWFGLTWSLELYQQANARLYRQGQKESVVINHIIAKGTMDEEVMKVIQNKEVNQEALLKAVKARLMEVLNKKNN